MELKIYWWWSFTFAAIGRFLGKRPLLEWVEERARGWNLSSPCTVSLTKKGNFIFRFNSEMDRDHLLSLSPLTMDQKRIKLLPWHPGQDEDEWPSIVPIWIRFMGLPYHCWSKDILYSLANSIGKPIKLTDITSSQRSLTYARLLVNIDLSKPRSHSILVNLEGEKELEIQVVHKNSPCSNCVAFGHSISTCPFCPTKIPQPASPNSSAQGRIAPTNSEHGCQIVGQTPVASALAPNPSTTQAQDHTAQPIEAVIAPPTSLAKVPHDAIAETLPGNICPSSWFLKPPWTLHFYWSNLLSWKHKAFISLSPKDKKVSLDPSHPTHPTTTQTSRRDSVRQSADKLASISATEAAPTNQVESMDSGQ